MKAPVFAALAAVLFLPLAANAQDAASSPPPRVGQACRADIQSFCPNVAPGPARRTCITTNMPKMSAGCQAAFNGRREAMKDVRKACGADIAQYCASAAAGPARHQCMSQNQTKFSSDCQAALAQEEGGGAPPAQPQQ